MAVQLDPRIEAVRKEYGLDAADFWQLQQNKSTWLVKHAALEIVATKAGILFDDPKVIEASTESGIAVMAVAGTMGDRREWATGEASPKNNKNAYPWAMAEKRAKDRVILKLVGIHGLVYSEDEMGEPEDQSLPKAKSRDLYAEMQDEIDACGTLDDLATLWRSKAFQAEFTKLKADWQEQLTERKDQRKAELTPKVTTAVPPDFSHMESTQ